MTQKIAFILTRFQDNNFFGGGERISFNLIKELCQQGFSVDVYCQEKTASQNYGIQNIITGKLEENFLKVKEMYVNGIYNHVVSENHLYPIDITLAHGHSVLYRQQTARTFLEKTISYFFQKSKKDFIKHQIHNLNSNNVIIVPSYICKLDYVNFLKIDEKKIKIIYPAITIINQTDKKKKNTDFTFGLSAPGFSNKGGYLFIFALFLLKCFRQKFKANIIYPNYQKNILVNFLINILGLNKQVIFLPFQADMQNFYNNIDCLIVPSNLETFGLVILESMANNIPVIISSRCGASEIIQDNKNGFIFNYEKFKLISLFRKMVFVVKNKNKLNNIVKQGFFTAQKYNWNRYCNKFIKIISSVAD